MDQKTKDRLKAIPKSICYKCGGKKSYQNSIEKCYECKKKFCFEHLFGGQIKEGMGENEGIRSICENCKDKHGYKTLGQGN